MSNSNTCGLTTVYAALSSLYSCTLNEGVTLTARAIHARHQQS